MKRINLIYTIACLLTIFIMTSCRTKTAVQSGVVTELTVEEEQFRPNFHFTPKNNWMNDPNGMFFLDGVYHLYFQYYPDGNKWGPMHWGHATSTDMMRWKEQPIALYPDNLGYIFSGSAVVDVANSSGLGDGKTAPIVAIYTYHDMVKEKAQQIDAQTQGLAYSLDKGMTWTKYEGNPIIKNPGIRDFRDPKVVYDKVNKQWLMVLAAQDRAKLYSSQNLKDWKFLSDFGHKIGAHGGVWECPDFFPLKVEGTNKTKWVLLQSLNPGGPNGGSATQYFIGDFDGKTFKLDPSFDKFSDADKGQWLDYGNDNYAGVTWDNIPASDGRKLMIGWMSNWEYAELVPTTKWRGSMTLPRELRLIQTAKGYAINTKPVSELDKYVSKKIKKGNVKVKNTTLLADKGEVDFSQTVIKFNLKDLKKDTYSFTLTNDAGEKLVFGINNVENYIFVDRSQSGSTTFSPKFGSPITRVDFETPITNTDFEIILDKTSIEIFINDGNEVITEIFFPSKPFNTFSANSVFGTEIQNLQFNQLKLN